MTNEQVRIQAIIDYMLPLMPGWCTPEKGKRLAELAHGSRLCVELGVFGGRSLVAIALGLSIQKTGQVDGIDPFLASAAIEGTNDPANTDWWAKLDYETIAKSAQESLYRLGLVSYAKLVRMTSREVVEFYADRSVDLLHQDANHSEETSSEEVALWAPKVKPGGFWVFDDTDWPSTQKAQRELEGLGFVELENHGNWKVYSAPTQ